jgi:hypothetical protein
MTAGPLQSLEPEASALDQHADRAIEMTSRKKAVILRDVPV